LKEGHKALLGISTPNDIFESVGQGFRPMKTMLLGMPHELMKNLLSYEPASVFGSEG
jgi:hypothetical protein